MHSHKGAPVNIAYKEARPFYRRKTTHPKTADQQQPFGLFPEVDSSDDDAGESDHDTSRDSDDAAADDRREENVVAIPF